MLVYNERHTHDDDDDYSNRVKVLYDTKINHLKFSPPQVTYLCGKVSPTIYTGI